MESDLKWDLKSQIIRQNTKTNTNTNTRRFSASNWKSFREDESYLRSTPTISSTVSSPGYTTREKIDPSTYSFTAAIKALQAKGSVCSWEYRPSEGITLHSKWSDAEKYISNPLSGEVPLECLSAKTLSLRSFSSLTNRITISAPLLYSSHFQTKFPIIQHQHKLNITIQEKKGSTATRDVGTQSVSAELSSGSPPMAPATPSVQERLTKVSEGESGDSSLSTTEKNPKKEVVQGEERESKEKEGRKTKEGRERKKVMTMCSQGGGRRGCCLSLKGLFQRDRKCKPRENNKAASSSSSSPMSLLYHFNACYDD